MDPKLESITVINIDEEGSIYYVYNDYPEWEPSIRESNPIMDEFFDMFKDSDGNIETPLFSTLLGIGQATSYYNQQNHGGRETARLNAGHTRCGLKAGHIGCEGR